MSASNAARAARSWAASPLSTEGDRVALTRAADRLDISSAHAAEIVAGITPTDLRNLILDALEGRVTY